MRTNIVQIRQHQTKGSSFPGSLSFWWPRGFNYMTCGCWVRGAWLQFVPLPMSLSFGGRKTPVKATEIPGIFWGLVDAGCWWGGFFRHVLVARHQRGSVLLLTWTSDIRHSVHLRSALCKISRMFEFGFWRPECHIYLRGCESLAEEISVESDAPDQPTKRI